MSNTRATTGRFLLTGAGFTHNFGGPLASEMWGRIISNRKIRELPSLRLKLLEGFDFEAIYHEVMTNGDEGEKIALQECVIQAYKQIDEIVRKIESDSRVYSTQGLVAKFAGSNGQPGFVFTLNQDLFMERNYYKDPRLRMPGIGAGDWFSSTFRGPVDPENFLPAPGQADIDKLRNQDLARGDFYYIKLHGSYGWRSTTNHHGMVIGGGKKSQIEREPILSWYLEIFRSCLFEPRARLFIIGYGFADDHVNNILEEAIIKHGLELFILDPNSPKNIQDHLKSRPEIWRGVVGFYQMALEKFLQDPLLEIFCEDFFSSGIGTEIGG